MKSGSILVVALLILISGLIFWHITLKTENYTMIYSIKTVDDIHKIFPHDIAGIKSLASQAIQEAEQRIAELIERTPEKRTVENTLYGFDTAYMHFRQAIATLEALVLLSPDDAIRTEAEKESVVLQKKFIDLFAQNKALYTVLNEFNEAYKNSPLLSAEEHYFLNETVLDYQRNGLDLPDEQRKKVIELQKELAELCTEFSQNIATDKSSITVTRNELAGLEDSFIDALKKTDDGRFILGVDYPTFFAVMSFAQSSETRKKLYNAFNNRAYPINTPVLQKIIEKRHELAQMLGFTSFAHLSLASEMVHNPERALQFLTDLLKRINTKEALEFKELTKELPPSVKLSNGKMHPWDKTYLIEQYKKSHFNLDENLITHYFPMDNTIKELLSIYEQFLNVTFKEEPIKGLWHPDVRCIAVYNNNQLAGYLLLDLYPRPNKFSHACQTTIIPARINNDGSIEPALAIVIANFPKATATQPALLPRRDVTTFFHEFGHALHALLGATHLAATSGTNVKTDFVEMPSQMLEEWLWDKDILKKISSHYQTGKPLSDDVINTLLSIKNISTGNDLQRQIVFGLLSLTLFNESDKKDIDAIFKKIYENTRVHEEFDPNAHPYDSFGHLTDYGAKYYSYLWSKVFALDLFETIKKVGLLNPEIGVRYKEMILAPGGSKDPNELLKDFLGREPNNDAFMHDLGL